MRRHFYVKAILALAAIGLLVGGVRGAFRAGWWQGYQSGQAAEPGEEGTTPYRGPRMVPPALMFPRAGPTPHWGYRPFGFLRLLLTLALLLFLFGLAAKTVGFWIWARRGGKDWRKAWAHGHPAHPHPPHPPSGGPWHRGPMPPWCCADAESDGQGETGKASGEEAPGEEQVAKVKPESES